MSFENIQLNNRFDLEVQENFYEETVTIKSFLEFDGSQSSYPIDLNLVGPHEEILDAIDLDLTGVAADLQFSLNTDADGNSTYSLSVLTSSTDLGIASTGITKFEKRLEIFSLPSALPARILTTLATVSSSDSHAQPGTFLVTDEDGNHILLNVGFFDHFDSNNSTGASSRRYFVEYIYLMDGTTPSDRYWVYRDENGNLTVSIDDRGMSLHDTVLDFNLTGRQFQEISDSSQALLQIEGDRYFGNLRVFPDNYDQLNLLRGAAIFLTLEFDEAVQKISLDRFDGAGHVEITQEEGIEGIELGELDFGGFRDANIQFLFDDDPERHRGDKVTITELSWILPGAATELTTAVNITFEFDPGQGGSNPQPSAIEGFQPIGAKTGQEGEDPYVDILFTSELDPNSAGFDYLIELKRHFSEFQDGGDHQAFSVAFDTADAVPFTPEDLDETYYLLSEEGDGSTLTLTPDQGSDPLTGTFFSQAPSREDEDGAYSLESDGSIQVRDTEGFEDVENIYKTDIALPQIDGQDVTGAFLIMIPDHDVAGNFEPEILFRSEQDRDTFRDRNLFDLVREDLKGDSEFNTNSGASETGIIEPIYKPVELVVEGRRLRAYFPKNAASAILKADARFELFINVDFGSSVPRGIRSVDGDLLTFGYVSLGNRRIFQNANFFPVSNQSQFVFERFGDNLSHDQSNVVTASMGSDGITNYVTDVVRGSLVQRFKQQGMDFLYCGDESEEGSECVTLWNMNSTVGSVLRVDGGGYVSVREHQDFFYAGGLEYRGAVVLEMILLDPNTIEKHNFVFVRDIGLVQHFTDLIQRETFEFSGFSGIELVGFKIGNQQRGRLEGLAGIVFEGLFMDFSFLQPDTFSGPLSMQFFQRGGSNTERLLAYSVDGGATSTDGALQDIAPGGENVRSVFFGKATSSNPGGIRPVGDKYNLIAKLSDANGNQEVRNVDLFTDQTDFYWFIDFAQTGGGGAGGPVLFGQDRFSFLRHWFIGEGDNTWDMEFDWTDPTSPLVRVLGASSGNGNRLIREVSEEGSFKEAREFFDRVISLNGLDSQAQSNQLTNEELDAKERQLYLIKIPEADRQEALGGDPAGDAYVLMLIKVLNSDEQKVEFSYVLSTDVTDQGASFFEREVNGTDPDFFEQNFGPGAPSRQGYLPLDQDECADLEIDPYDFITGDYNERRAVDACTGPNGDFSVTRLAIVTNTNAPEESGTYRGILEFDLEVPGGYERLPFKMWDVWQMPFAAHPSLLSKDTSPTTVTLRLPFDIRYNGYCEGGVWTDQSYTAVENHAGGNDFLFHLNTWVEFHDPANDPNSSGSAGSTQDPTTLEECLAMMRPRVDMHYQYYSFQRLLSDLEMIPVRGDFNGTGMPHPAGSFGTINQMLQHQDDPNSPDDDILVNWANVISSLDASVLSTFTEACFSHDGTVDPNCQGPQRFRVGTDDIRMENWGVRASFSVTGFDENHPLYYVLAAYSPTNYREQPFTMPDGNFALGSLRPGFDNKDDGTSGGTAAGGNSSGTQDSLPELYINFGPHWFAFDSIHVNQLTFRLPYSRLGADVAVDKMLESQHHDGGGSGDDFLTVNFDPQDAVTFEAAELNGDWYTYLPDEEGKITFNPTAGSDPLAGAFTFEFPNETETGTWIQLSNGSIEVVFPNEGPELVYKAIIPLPQLNGADIQDVLVILYELSDQSGKYEPELFFRSMSDRDAFSAAGLWDQIDWSPLGGISSGGSGTGGTGGGSASQMKIRAPFRVEGISHDGTSLDPLVVRFSHKLPAGSESLFVPASLGDVKSAQNMDELTEAFGPGSFMIFKDLSFPELFKVFSWQPEGPSSVATLTALVTDLGQANKIIDVGDLPDGVCSGASSDFLMDDSDPNNVVPIQNAVAITLDCNNKFDAALNDNWTFMFSPFLRLPDPVDSSGSSGGSTSAAGSGNDDMDDDGLWLDGTKGFGKVLEMAPYTDGMSDLTYIARNEWLEDVDFDELFSPDRTSLNWMNQQTHSLVRTVDQLPQGLDFLTENQISPDTVTMGNNGTFGSLINSLETVIWQEDFVQPGENPVLEDVTVFYRLSNGSLHFVADYEAAFDNDPAEVYFERGMLEGETTPKIFSGPILANLMDLANGTATETTLKVGQNHSQSRINHVTGSGDQWWAWRNRETIEVIAYAQTGFSLQAHGGTTSVNDLLVIDITNHGESVKSDSEDGPWVVDEDGGSPGHYESIVLFLSPGVGLVLEDESWVESESYCHDANQNRIWHPQDPSTQCVDQVQFEIYHGGEVSVNTAFENFNEDKLPQSAPAPIRFTVNSANFAYSISGGNAGSGSFPPLTLVRGQTYEFDLQVESAHPFRISDSFRGTEFNDGMEQDQPSGGGMTSGVITWTVPQNAPDSMDYYCTVHSNMNGTISIVD